MPLPTPSIPVPQPLVIVGSGGLAREVHQLIEDINAVSPTYEVLGWLDGNPLSHGSQVHGLPVLGDIDWLLERPDVAVTIGIGAPQTRRRVVQRIEALGPRHFATLVHPRAVIGNRIQIGQGVTICAGVVATTDLQIGQHVLINICATVAHEDMIHDFVTIAPAANISGNVTLGEGTDLGTNATVIQGVSIGEWSIIGAGAVVTRPIAANVTAVGAPAKVIKERESGWHL